MNISDNIELANFANLFRQTPEMICVLAGPEHRFEFVNQAHIRALGFDATGKTVREAQPESVEVHGILDEVYRTGKTAELVEIPVTLTDRVRYFNLTYAARRDSAHNINGIMILGAEVTDMVLARRAQENQHKWLESVLNRLPIPIFFIDPKTEVSTFQNNAATDLLGADISGLSAEQKQNTGFLLASRESKPLTRDELPSIRAIRGEKLQDFRVDLQTVSGNYALEVSSDVIPETFGQPSTVLLVMKDITAQKKVQRLLQKSEEQLSLALNTSKVGFYDWDIAQNAIAFSPQMRSDWGLPTEGPAMTLQKAITYIHPDDQKRVEALVNEAMVKKQPYHTEYRVVRPDGKMVWLDVRGDVHFSESGEPQRFFGTSIDISARVENERAFRAMADSMPQVVWGARPDGVLDYINQKWIDYSGSADPTRWLEFVHPEDRERTVALWSASVATGTSYEVEFRLLRQRDQTYRWHLGRANATCDEASNIIRWFGTCTDIEDQKRSEHALRDANLVAQSASAAKTAFLANMSHEIRTPLGAILGFVSLMRSPKATHQQIDTYLSVIERNSDQLLRIVDDILDLSKVEAGQMVIEYLPFSLQATLADISSFMGMRSRERGVTFNLKSSSNLPSTIKSDPTRVRQILMNIVGNAVKFTEKGEVTLEISYEAPNLYFRVTDTGIGISQANQKQIFSAFSQGDASVTRKFGGTGLGLVLTRRLCELLGGDFRLVQSQEGMGSIFEARIVAESALLPEGKTDSRLGGQNALEGLRVLVVEDLPDNQTFLRILLEELGARIHVVSDGRAGVETALKNEYDIILMDIQMPGMDGHTATRMLRSRGYQKPILALTAHAMKQERAQALISGFSGFLSKPISRPMLIEAIRTVEPMTPKTSQPTQVDILIVDDDSDLRELLTGILKMHGYSPIGVSSGEEALEHIEKSSRPLVMMIDLTLPVMSGSDLAEKITARPDRQRFRIIVASGWDDLPNKAKALGAEGHARKPFDMAKISTMIQTFIRELSAAS